LQWPFAFPGISHLQKWGFPFAFLSISILHKTAASEYLTAQSGDFAVEALAKARQLIADIKTKAWFID